jgi:hypothetical protein
MPPQKRTPATAMTGALKAQADKLSLRAKPKTAGKQELLDRLDVLEVLSRWKLQLQSRLAREKLIFLYSDSNRDFGELAREVEDFKRVCQLLSWARRQAP